MRWQGRRESDNVEDRRGMRGGTMVAGGGLGTVVIVILALVFGVDPQALLNQGAPPPGQAGPAVNPNDQASKFVKVVLADTEDVWNEQFKKLGKQYREPKLVLFSGAVRSACGTADSAVGPFYCPGDQTVYIDLQFFEELKAKFGAPGDFAQAYVIAHEVGHHVQRLLGKTAEMDAQRGRVSKTEYNRLSVQLELQADFYAGVWAHHADKKFRSLEQGDIEEALRAANVIGDDAIQRKQRGTVVPDSFTHGTSAQRMRWFKKGLESGDIRQGDTFSARDL